MKHLLSLAILLWLTFSAAAQEKIFSGKFDNKFNIRLHLTLNGKKVIGHALHQKTSKKYAITGKADRNDQLQLTETDANGTVTGQYDVAVFANYLLKGTYKTSELTVNLILKIEDPEKVTSEEEFLDEQLFILSKLKENDKKHIKEIMSDFLACTASKKKKSYCDRYLAMAYFHLHGYDDFGFGKNLSEFKAESEMIVAMEKSPMWNKKGMAENAELLSNCIEWAKEGIPVLIVKRLKGEEAQIALVVPEDGSLSGKWGEVMVPTSAFFFLEQPDRSFSNKAVSEAWSSPKEIEIWVRDGELKE